MLDDSHVAKSSRLRTEPSTTADVFGENLAFETGALPISKQSAQIRCRVQSRDDTLSTEPPALGLWLQGKPIMGMRIKRDEVRRFLDRRKRIATKNFDRDATGESRQIEFNRLGETAKVHDHDNSFVFVTAKEREHLGVVGVKKFEGATRESLEILSRRDHTTHPPKQRGQVFLLILDIDGFVVVLGVDDDREMKLLRI